MSTQTGEQKDGADLEHVVVDHGAQEAAGIEPCEAWSMKFYVLAAGL